MLILVDKRAPEIARNNLEEYGEVVEFYTEELVYEAIAGHPDIFITQIENLVVISPNLPDKFKILINKHKVNSVEGELPIGNKYPETARYNAASTDQYIIHNLAISDIQLLKASQGKTSIQVPQGYTRCNLVVLNENKMITTDKGIQKALISAGMDVMLVRSEGILLPGFSYGFIGGTCGIVENKILFLGSLKHHIDGNAIEAFIRKTGFEILELYDGPLFDGGGIFFLR